MYYKKTSTLKVLFINSLFFIAFCFPMLVCAENKVKQECVTYDEPLTKTNNILFVDVRAQQFFNIKNIPNSINVPLQLVSTKAFLKDKQVVLVGNGWNEQVLMDDCLSLKNNGYKSIRVLAGGITSWFKRKNIPLKRAFISLSSKEFFNNKLEKKFVPFVISNSTKKQITAVLPYAKIVSLETSKKQLLKGFARLGKGINPIVIFSDASPVIDAAINDYLRKPLRKMYYFEGGFNAYKQVDKLNKMTTASNQHKRLSTKKPVSCAN